MVHEKHERHEKRRMDIAGTQLRHILHTDGSIFKQPINTCGEWHENAYTPNISRIMLVFLTLFLLFVCFVDSA
jgi:hypothetical protein